MQQFWKLIKPAYNTISQDNTINGYLDHPIGLPGVACENCHKTWGGSRVLPYNCPERFIKRPELKNRWPITGAQHALLRREIEAALWEKHNIKVYLLPGYEFQPNSLSISGPPKTDFLWSSLDSFCVTERIKKMFEENKFTGAVFVPVTIKKIGKGKTKVLPLKIKDFNTEYEIPIDDPKQSDVYYEMIITGRSKRPPGAEIISRCELCEREEFDTKKRSIEMKADMWNGEDIFYIETTLYAIVTDAMKKQLEEMKVSNTWFERCC